MVYVFFKLLVFLGLFSFVVKSTGVFANEEDSYVIDIAAPLDLSPSFTFNYVNWKAIALAEEYINEKNLIPGAKLNIHLYDWNGSLEDVAGNFHANEEIVLFVGLGSTERTTMLNEINDYIFFRTVLSLSNGSKSLESDFVIRNTVSSTKTTNTIMSFIRAAGFKRVSLIGALESYSESLIDELKIGLGNNFISIANEYMAPFSDNYDSGHEDLYQSIFDAKSNIIILHGLVNFMTSVLKYGIMRNYIGNGSDGSLVFIIGGGCQRLFEFSEEEAEYLSKNLGGHICMDESITFDESFQRNQWNPIVTDEKLTDEEKEIMTSENWMDRVYEAGIAYDSVMWIARGIVALCYEYSDPKECYAELATSHEKRMELHNIIKSTSFDGASGLVEENKSSATIGLSYCKFLDEDDLAGDCWVEFAEVEGSIFDVINKDLLTSIPWPDKSFTIPEDVVLDDYQFLELLLVILSLTSLFVSAILLSITIAVKSPRFYLGLFGKKDCIVILICCICGSVENASFFMKERTTLICSMKYVFDTSYLFMGTLITMGLARFHDVLLNRKLNKVHYISKNYKAFWITVTAVFCLIRYAAYSNPVEVLQFHDPDNDYNVYWSACRYDVLSSLDVSNLEQLFGTESGIIILWIMAFVCSLLMTSTITYARPMLRKTKRLIHVIWLRRILFIAGVSLMACWIVRMLSPNDNNMYDSEASTATTLIAASSDASDDGEQLMIERFFNNDQLTMTIPETRGLVNGTEFTMLLCCLMGVACVFAELMFIARRWDSKHHPKHVDIFAREKEIPATSSSINRRLDLQKNLVPNRILSLMVPPQESFDETSCSPATPASHKSFANNSSGRLPPLPSRLPSKPGIPLPPSPLQHEMSPPNGSDLPKLVLPERSIDEGLIDRGLIGNLSSSFIPPSTNAPRLPSQSVSAYEYYSETATPVSGPLSHEDIVRIGNSLSNSAYFRECRALVAYLSRVTYHDRLNVFCALKNQLRDLKTKHMYEQLHVKTIEDKLRYMIDRVEILGVTMKRIVPKSSIMPNNPK